MSTNPVRAYLAERGCSEAIVRGGLRGLASRWEHVVEEVSEGYSLGLDDYRNDLDVRDILAGALAVAPGAERAPLRERLERADERFRALTEETGSLWGETVARERGLDPVHTWWYFRRPTKPGRTLARELSARKL